MLGVVDVCPNGANTRKTCLLDGWLGVVRLRGREDGVKGVAAVVVGCPAEQGQATTSVAWRMDDSRGVLEAKD